MTRSPTALLLAILGLPGCAGEPACNDPCGCPEAEGVCCSGWLEPDGAGRCVARAWPPTDHERFDAPGADAVEVAVDGLGRPLVSWQARRVAPDDTRSVLMEQTEGGWQRHVLGAREDGFGARATIAARGLEAWVAWSQQADGLEGGDGSSVHLLRRDATGTWIESDVGQRVSFSTRAYEPRPVLAVTGERMLVWNQWRDEGGYGVAVATQAFDADTLTLPTTGDDLLSPDVFFSNAPQPAIASNGDAIITWYQAAPDPDGAPGNSDGLRIYVSERSRETGAFSRPSIDDNLSPPGPPVANHEVRNPVAAIDERGAAIVAWSQMHPSGVAGLYVAERSGLGAWTAPETIDDAFVPLDRFATGTSVAMTTTGEAHLVWFDGPAEARVVLTAHRTPARTWDARGVQLSTPGRPAQDPRLAVGPDGEAVIVWTEQADGRWRVMGSRRGPLGTAWGDPTELSIPAEGHALGPTVAIGPDGTMAAAWTHGPTGTEGVTLTTLE